MYVTNHIEAPNKGVANHIETLNQITVTNHLTGVNGVFNYAKFIKAKYKSVMYFI